MTQYQVQKGDTIADVTSKLHTSWKALRQNNPQSIGKAKNGNWFLKEGATINTENAFDKTLQQVTEAQSEKNPTPPVHLSKQQQKIMYSIDASSSQPVEHSNENSSKSIVHTIQKGETLWDLAVNKYHVHIKDIMQDNRISDPTKLQIGQQLTINLPQNEGEKSVVASWYGEDFHGRPMANGRIYDMNAATIAHKEIPLGTQVELKNETTGEMVKAVVTDRGPYVEGRDVDLSYGLAQKLSLVEQGIGKLTMRIL